ncbi:hypothetical protein I5R16_09670 [Serratia marcescens]|nr:hypothetical protein [Serratia marcescens]
MDNKLSELSKPVAYDYQIAGACIADGHNENGKWVDWNNKLSRYCPPDWMMEEGKVTGLKPLYSQEYVSALLAENEEKEKLLISNAIEYEISATDLLAELEAKDKRIADLEAKNAQLKKELHNEGAANAHAYERIRELEKWLEESRETTLLVRDEWQKDKERADTAEKRLATPVRLLGEMLVHDWEHSVERQATFQHRKIAWDARMAEDKKAILAAGFTFTVEGDSE